MRRSVSVAASVLDQAASSLTNIACVLIAARVSTAEGFADFSLVQITFGVLLGLNMAHVGQTLVLERGDDTAVGAAARSSLAFTAAASVTAALLLAALGALLGGGTGRAFLALAAVLPVTLLQDGLRYAFSALRRPDKALAADLLRLGCVLPALLLQPPSSSAARLVLVWGLAALPAALLGLLLLRPYVAGHRTELRRLLRRDHLGRRFVVEYAVGSGSSQLAVLGLGLFAAPLAVGALRGATTLFGPLNVLFISVNTFGPPLLGRAGSRRGTIRSAVVLGGALCLVASGWAAVLAALPDRYGRELLGATWETASALLPASGAQYAVMALGTCALVTLRVLSPKATLSVQVVFSLLSVALMLGGYALGGVLGAAWGLAAGSALKAVAAWTRVARTRPEAPAPEPAEDQRSSARLS
ncbi:hypothetical protein ACGFMM_00200 [Streptomyces sp. NPDC048604]|uniref:hypothetical protein n=1 Tax=Streptomyces sp. NPDC048604 TaxID=3365578 RepID=UPI003711F993